MGLTKPIEQYLFSNLLTKIHIVVYLKDIIRGEYNEIVGSVGLHGDFTKFGTTEYDVEKISNLWKGFKYKK